MLPAWQLNDRFWLSLAIVTLVVAWSMPVVAQAVETESHLYFALGFASAWSVLMSGIGFGFHVMARKDSRLASLALVLATATLILLYRVPTNFVDPQFWAEDALIFFKQQHEMGWNSIFLSYAGYFDTMARILCLLIAPAPVLFFPALYNLAWLAIYSLVTAYIFFQYPDKKWAPAIAVTTAFVSHNGEVFMNLTNVIWITGLAMTAMVLLPVPALKRGPRYALAGVLLIFSLSGPFSLILAPFYILRGLMDRKGFPWIYAVIVVAAAAIQFWGLQSYYAEKQPALPETFSTLMLCLKVAVIRVPWALAVGYFPYEPYWIIGLLGGILLLGFIAWEIKSDVRKNIFPIGCLVLCAIYVMLDLVRAFPAELVLTMVGGDRYFYIPKILVVWTLIYFASTARNAKLFEVALLFCVLGSVVEFTDRKPIVDNHWPQYADLVDEGGAVVIPINPPGWTVLINGKNELSPSK